MISWSEFCNEAPAISAVFTRRHAAASSLCLLATLRADGSPRISPMEPRIFEDRLWLAGMPGTTKFADLARDPRFCLHTATTSTDPVEGDAKLWGQVVDVADFDQQQRFAEHLFNQIGLDLRGQTFEHLYAADLTSASTVITGNGHMDITVWNPTTIEHHVRKRVCQTDGVTGPEAPGVSRGKDQT